MASSCTHCSPTYNSPHQRIARPSLSPGSPELYPTGKVLLYKNGTPFDPLKAKRTLIPSTWGKVRTFFLVSYLASY